MAGEASRVVEDIHVVINVIRELKLTVNSMYVSSRWLEMSEIKECVEQTA